MKKLIGVSLLLVTAFYACKTDQSASSSNKDMHANDPIIAKVGNEPVYASEFNYVYSKNNAKTEDAYTSESINEYLDLYLKFRLKVKEAKALGLDTLESFKKELDGYKKQVSKQYMTEDKVIDELTKEAYDHMTEDLEVSHILIQVEPNAAPEDSLKAYNKAKDILKRIKDGEDFGKLAKEYSHDKGSAVQDGYLGYFTALNFVYPFEKAAYNTPVGEISKPVRSRFGYHIIKVHSKRPSQGKVKVAHIMVRANPGIEAEDSIAAKRKIDEIYNRLQKGEDWGELTKQYSEDNTTKSKGGEMNWFKLRQTRVPAFEEAAFKLKEAGEISEPVYSGFGWHVIKLIDREGLESFESMEQSLRSEIQRKHGAAISNERLIARLKKENNFVENKKGYEIATSYADSSLLNAKWSFNAEDKAIQGELFSINEKKYSIKDFFVFVEETHKRRQSKYAPKHYMRLLYDDYVNKTVIEYEENNLANKYEDYRMLINEYRDGILLFQLMDEKVWSKAIEDTTGLKNFFEEHRDDYMWKFRAKATIYSLPDKETVEKVKKALKENPDATASELQKSFNTDNPLNMKVDEGTFQKGENEVLDAVKWQEGEVVHEMNGLVHYIIIEEIEGPRRKTLDESRGLVISDYQNYLEQQWITELKKKYPIKVYEEEVNKLIKE